VSNYYDQAGYDIRFDWGADGTKALAPLSDIVIIVDMLSFSTCVDVGVSRGGAVLPFTWKGEKAQEYAKENDALLAVRRGEEGISLSPPSLEMLPDDSRIVLPSPDGSTLTLLAQDHARTIAGSVRNRTAVAKHANQLGGTITVIACGERWHHGEALRPAIEDQIGCGAIIDKLTGRKSPEAQSAEAVFLSVQDKLPETLNTCASGIELIEKGYAEDVAYASAIDVSTAVPVLIESTYRTRISKLVTTNGHR